MVERICLACQHGNPLDDRYCGKCGAPLERQVLARRSEGTLTIGGRELPVTWRQVGRTAAIGAAALAAEVGLAWLRHKVEGGSPPALAKTAKLAPLAKQPGGSGSVITIVSQRVLEIFQHDDGHIQINDRHTWQRRDE